MILTIDTINNKILNEGIELTYSEVLDINNVFRSILSSRDDLSDIYKTYISFDDNTDKLLKSIKNEAGIYRLHDNDGEIIYIGKSFKLGSRISQSIKHKQNEVSSFSYMIVEDICSISDIEDRLISIQKPRLNKLIKSMNYPTSYSEVLENYFTDKIYFKISKNYM